MSRIYFHTSAETVEVYGTERAHIGRLCTSLAAGVFDMLSWERKNALMPRDRRDTGDKLGIANRVDEKFRVFLGVFSERHFSDGSEVFAVVLNTVLRLGSPAMALAARIHGQCELHGYVEPEDGEFIAELIEQGLATGVFREFLPRDGVPTEHRSGWRDAARLLRAGEVVVTSYSVSDTFPNAGICANAGLWTPDDDDWDAWYELGASERWAMALEAVRGTPGLRWEREGWNQFYFRGGGSALDYINAGAYVRT